MSDKNADWWRGTVIYQVYPRSYQDSNQDGVGDLPGITQRLGYIADLGVDAIWLSPFFRSPMADFGYDISDFCGVDPMFGTLSDYERLLSEAHRLGLRVIIDQVISHTASQHPWFQESATSRDNPKADWYVWVEPREDGTPPNNWLANFGGTSWEWNTRRRQYYFHNFLVSQPDLNFHNPEVQTAVLDVLRFWLELGTDGFRLDTVNYYFHDRELRNNPPWPKGQPYATAPESNPYSHQDHIYDKTRPENLVFLQKMRRLVDSYPGRILVGELGVDGPGVGKTLSQYTEKDQRLHMAYIFELLTDRFSPAYVRQVAEKMTQEIGDGWICWCAGNHDFQRVVSRWGLPSAAAPLVWALVQILRGSASVYQGDELALPEAVIPFADIQDPYGKNMWPEFVGRDGCRTPMPWQAEGVNAGFSPVKPWLPIPKEHLALAVDREEKDAASPLNRAAAFTRWRRSQVALRQGGMTFVDAPESVLCLVRDAGKERILVALNFSPTEIRFRPEVGKLENLAGHGFGGKVVDTELVIGGYDAAFCRI